METKFINHVDTKYINQEPMGVYKIGENKKEHQQNQNGPLHEK